MSLDNEVFFWLMNYFIFFFFCNPPWFLSNYFLPKNLKPENVVPWISYVYSTIHAVIIFLGSLLFLYEYVDTEIYKNFHSFSIGYLIFDSLIVASHRNLFKKTWKLTVFHHSIFLYTSLIMKMNVLDLIQQMIVARYILAELSTLFLNAAWFLIHLNMQETIYFKLSTLSTLISYSIVRIYNFTDLTYIVVLSYPLYGSIPAICITLLNYYWFYLLLKKYVQGLFKRKIDTQSS